MQSETDSTLMMNTADAAPRPWQFSIRGLLLLTFVASILFTLMSRYGYHGFLAFLMLLAIALLLVGIVLNRNQYIAWGLLFLFASFGKTGILIIMIASGLYVLTGAMILGSEWLLSPLRNRRNSRKSYQLERDRPDAA